MNWILKIESLPSILRISLYEKTYHGFHTVTIENIEIESYQENHTKIYKHCMKNKGSVEVSPWGLRFYLSNFHVDIVTAAIVDVDFKYKEMLDSEDIETQKLAVALFMAEILEAI